MKYVMFRCTDSSGEQIDIPVIFPKIMIHRMIAGQLSSVLRNQHGYQEVSVISAGDTNIHCFSCSGESETIGVSSRGEKDREIITHHDVNYGFVDHSERVPGRPRSRRE